MKKEQKTHDIKNVYFQKKYRHCVIGKKKLFEKEYNLLSN